MSDHMVSVWNILLGSKANKASPLSNALDFFSAKHALRRKRHVKIWHLRGVFDLFKSLSVDYEVAMNLFTFELQVQRKMHKGVLKNHICALGLTCSPHAWNWNELGPPWPRLSVGNIEVSGF